MDSLKIFLKSLETDEAREAFAGKCGTTLGHMRNASYGLRPLAPEICASAERESGGALVCDSLRPDLPWTRISDPKWKWHSKGRPVVDVTAQRKDA